jgi:hypothetical protein
LPFGLLHERGRKQNLSRAKTPRAQRGRRPQPKMLAKKTRCCAFAVPRIEDRGRRAEDRQQRTDDGRPGPQAARRRSLVNPQSEIGLTGYRLPTTGRGNGRRRREEAVQGAGMVGLVHALRLAESDASDAVEVLSRSRVWIVARLAFRSRASARLGGRSHVPGTEETGHKRRRPESRRRSLQSRLLP